MLDYFSQFKNKKTNIPRERSRDKLEILFIIYLLNRFFCYDYDYDYETDYLNYIRNQIWGYLISKFEVNHKDSIGHSFGFTGREDS